MPAVPQGRQRACPQHKQALTSFYFEDPHFEVHLQVNGNFEWQEHPSWLYLEPCLRYCLKALFLRCAMTANGELAIVIF